MPRARTQLDSAAQFVAADSPAAASRLVADALEAAESLQILSERGRIVPEFGIQQVRELFVGRYRLLYRVLGDEVQILGFLHGAQDIRRFLRFVEEHSDQ